MKQSIKVDFHVHTHYSPCGREEATPAAMINNVKKHGFQAIGFSDHVSPDPQLNCSFYDQQRPVIIDSLRRDIVAINPQGIRVLVGLEADYVIAGTRCLDDETLQRADHVICASSHFHLTEFPQYSLMLVNLPSTIKAKHMVQMATEALFISGISVWAHPFCCRMIYDEFDSMMKGLSDAEIENLVMIANEQEIAIEINGAAAYDIRYRSPVSKFYQIARESGARFTIGSDAHHPDYLLKSWFIAYDWAMEMGFTDNDFLTLDEFLDRQTRKKSQLVFDAK